jgi:hypothetical protein
LAQLSLMQLSLVQLSLAQLSSLFSVLALGEPDQRVAQKAGLSSVP